MSDHEAARPALTACVIVVLQPPASRVGERRVELLMAKRSSAPRDRFLSGFHAFVGGRLEPKERAQIRDGAPGSELRALRDCAIRELYEELGLLCLKGRGCLTELSSPEISPEDRAAMIRDVIDKDRYRPAGRWTTPHWAPVRFETEFFLLALSHTESDRVRAMIDRTQRDAQGAMREGMLRRAGLEHARAMPASAWLTLFERAEALLSLPTIAYLEAFAAELDTRHAMWADIRRHADAVPDVIIHRDQRDVDDPIQRYAHAASSWMVPLKSPTLLPATHTNAFVIGDEERFVVVDPGAEEEAEMAPLFELLDALIARGATCEAVVLTHHHDDHISGVPHLFARYGALDVWAHEVTLDLSERVLSGARTTRALTHGELLDIAAAHTLEVLFTPGHAPGHVALLHRESASIFCGDLVASQGTILVAPPRGDMGDYLESLGQIAKLSPSALYPAHGWPIQDALATIEAYLDHRLQREESTLRALLDCEAGERVMAYTLVPQVYEDLEESLWPLAAMSLEAHLIHLSAWHENVHSAHPEGVPGTYWWEGEGVTQ